MNSITIKFKKLLLNINFYYMKKIIFICFLSIGLLQSCTTDREINSEVVSIDPTSVLVHYWNFNSLSGTLSVVNPDFSLLPTIANIKYNGTGAGYMDTFTPGYSINAKNNDVAGLGIRTRNPSDTRNLLLTLPTVGYKAIIVQFATAKSGSGATTQSYSYSIDGSNYITNDLTTTVFNTTDDPNASLVTLDFSQIIGVNNNPNFKIKIDFSGATASGATGNNRFDNVSLVGIPLSLSAPPSDLSYTSNNTFLINNTITPLSPTVTGNVISYSISPNLPIGLTIDSSTGVISGTPTAISSATNYTITATNNFGSTSFIVSISVANAPLLLLHYWNFNNLSTGTLNNVNADTSLISTTSATIKYNGTGAGYMDQYTPGSTANAQNSDVAGLGLRLRNPSDTRNVLISSPTTGYKNVIVRFATARSSTSGASIQNYSYTLDGTNFLTTNLPVNTFNPNIDPTYDIITLDFTSITGANNNPNFKVKINFGGVEASGASGNNRLDNVTIQANQI